MTILGVADELRASLADVLADAGAEACKTTLYPGERVVADYCRCDGAEDTIGSCGQAWVRVDRAFASSQAFPRPDSTPSCNAVIAAVFEVGIYRCLPTVRQVGRVVTPPAIEGLTNAAAAAARDLDRMLCAIRQTPAVTKRPHVIGTYQPRSEGTCGGGVWPVTVQMVRV